MIDNRPVFIHHRACGSGMGALIIEIITWLQFYEFGIISGIKLDFRKSEFYYEKKYGDNWWEYYFEPLSIGAVKEGGIKEVGRGLSIGNANYSEFFHTRKLNNHLFNKYIKIKQRVLDKVESYVTSNFKDHFIIGLHYRAVIDEKRYEAPVVHFERVFEALDKQMGPNYKIFVASDDNVFINKLLLRYPNKILYYNILRHADNRPLYMNHPSPYQCGEDALIDCVLLSRANLLMRTSSNLSYVSSILNPDIPEIALSHRIGLDHKKNAELEIEYHRLRAQAENGIPPFELLKWVHVADSVNKP